MRRLMISLMLLASLLLLIACSEDGNPSSDGGDNEEVDIVINEFLAKNDSLVADEYGEYDDWIELYNRGSVEANLAGYTMTDNPAEPQKWRIPDTNPELTTIQPGQYLIVWADSDTLQGVLHLDFSLSTSGEDIGLFEPDGSPVDLVHFNHQYSNVTMGRSPNGSSSWYYLQTASMGSSNSQPVANLEPIVVDVRHNPVIPREGQAVRIEVEAYDDGEITAVELTYQVDGSAEQTVNLEAGDDLWTTYLPGQSPGVEVSYYVTVTDDDDASVTDPRFAPANTYSYRVPDTDYAPPLFINEFLAANGSINSDEAGDFDDWIELYNSGSEAIDMAGMYLSDDPTDPFLFQFPLNNPASTTILPGGYLLVWADNETEEGALHANFKLSADGEAILLHASDFHENVMIDSYVFGEQQEDISEGRLPNGSSNWVFLSVPTPGAGNSP